jgi:hypothetical protein
MIPFAFLGSPAYAQTGSSTAALSGVVTDVSGAVVPGVSVVIKHNATGVVLTPIVTNNVGLFTAPSLDPGIYEVTFSLPGFRTVVMRDVRLTTATPADLKVTLELGPVSETVAVTASSELVQRQSTATSSTLYSEQIKTLPLNTRDTLNFVTLLPGVDTGSNHVQRNQMQIAGLPQTAVLVSIDGIQTRSIAGGAPPEIFSYISPSVDAVEEVTVSTGTPGADASGQGAAQIRFTTRSGGDRYRGSFFETLRYPALNTNTFFNKVNNLPLNRILLNQFGGNVGGPIVAPGLISRGKAFFFANYEELRQYAETSRNRTVITPAAQSGLFSYTAGAVLRQVNVLNVAAANGQIATVDPTIRNLLAQISAATATKGSATPNSDGNTSSYLWNSPDDLVRKHSNNRIDVNLNQAHRLSLIAAINKYRRSPDGLTNRDPRFPGMPNQGMNDASRYSITGILRSILSPNLVNELTAGRFWMTGNGGQGISADQFGNQGGHSLQLAGGSVFATVAPATGGALVGPLADANGSGNHSSPFFGSLSSVADKVSWQRGRHFLQFGAEATFIKSRDRDRQIVPAVSFGVDSNDPAIALFTGANFPGASTANLGDAQFLYALLTGRVTQITTELGLDPVLRRYVSNGFSDRPGHFAEIGFFVQDSFRMTSSLTLNAGLRYELQLPFQAETNVWSANSIADACGLSGIGNGPGGRPCNFFKPGTLTGQTPVYEQFQAGTSRYDLDRNNLAPNVGVAWLPGVKTGLLHSILGNPDQATIRAGYSRAFTREGTAPLSNQYDLNPGAQLSVVRNVFNGNLVLPGETWPLLLTDTTRGTLPPGPAYPLAIDRTSGVNLLDPRWEVASVDSFTAGVQRSLSRDMALEVRYLGTRGRNLRRNENWNEVNLIENGFLAEFKLAQANLYANIAAQGTQSIKYMGPGTGTSPLPIYLAYFNGSTNASDPLAYTGTAWKDTKIVGRFAQLNPNPLASVNTDLHGDAARRVNAINAGLPANFFVLNPDVGTVNVRVSTGSSRYDALQIELRRRMSNGLAMTASYSFTKYWESRLDSVRTGNQLVPSLNAAPHSLKLTASYETPFGRSRHFGSQAGPWLDKIAGAWSINMTGRVTSGAVLDFGNVRLVGMTREDLQRSFEYRTSKVVNPDGSTTTRVYNLPQDIIDNTVKAFSTNVTGYTVGAPTGRYFAPASGPDCIQALRGDCAPKDIFVVAPIFSRFDLGMRKRIPMGETKHFLIEADVLNLFDAINFNPVGLPATPTSPDSYRVMASYSDTANTSDPGSRSAQLVFRFNW